MKYFVFPLFILLVWIQPPIYGQLSYLEHNPVTAHLLDRLETSGAVNLGPNNTRTVNLMDLINMKIDTTCLVGNDRHDWHQLQLNIPERKRYLTDTLFEPISEKSGLLNSFYKTPYSFFTVDTEDFFLKADPVIHFGFGNDHKDNKTIFQNTRGIKIRGTLDDKIYFYTSILENQQRFLHYIEDEIERIQAIPGQGFFKNYQSGIFDGINGWDFLNAEAYAGLKISKSIDMRLGHGRHFIGEGIRSMILSDYAHNYFYLQFNTNVWKFNYQNTFAELSVNSSKSNSGNQLLPKKYMATHYLSFQFSPRLTIGLYESVIFSRQNNFEFQYLNPVILYRSVEQFLDSPDNALLGLNFKWIVRKNWQLYGQILIDELRTGEIFSGDGWWGNKIGYQLGIKKFDLFAISHLDVQLEYNSARPYTYAHRDDDLEMRPTTSYSHFNQPLAHPYGANFRETIFNIKYRPHQKFNLHATLLFSNYGTSEFENIGRNILDNYEDRTADFGNYTGQGTSNKVMALHFDATWQFYPNYYIDFQYINRNQSIQDSFSKKTSYYGIGLRVNIFNRPILL